MLNNNHKNIDCGFGEALVSYLYGEIEASEKQDFEAHLASCRSCAEELSAFRGVHFSINQWIGHEFQNLPTPSIELVPESAEPRRAPVEIAGVSRSWLDRLRDLFALAPAWSTAGAVFSLLAVFAVVALVALNRDRSVEISLGNKTQGKNLAAPTAEPVSPGNVANAAVSDAAREKTFPLTPNAVKPEAPSQPDPVLDKRSPSKAPAVKVNETAPATPKNGSATRNATKNNRPANGNAPRKSPSLAPYDDDEDESLRLSDLFAEIDTD